MIWPAMVRRHIGWKLFASYLAVILVGVVVFMAAAEYAGPRAFTRHTEHMFGPGGGGRGPMGPGGMGPGMGAGQADLVVTVRRAMTETFLLAAAAALAAAFAASLVETRRSVTPLRSLMEASQRIAAGRYGERVPVHGEDELGRLGASFNRMAEALARTEEQRRALIADVAHELRTPLSGIKGYMEGLIDGVIPAGVETFQTVHREADRLQRLVSDLQDLSRLEAGQVALQARRAEVGALVQAAVARLRPQFDDKEIAVAVEVGADLPVVVVDEDRIVQVMINLLGNALQFTPAGGRVRVEARRGPEGARVTVTDTGVGIPVEHLPHLFERFYRVDRSRSRAAGGSGIGLTIARHLVEAHG
ncbi:MAG: HAMP domain-containing protein, partial [Armatimonadetes bacterium]|nr:HAMP domain-containing protein [Armatimonadota bacterium]